MQHDAVALAVFHKVGEVAELFLRNMELAGHSLEHVLAFVAVALTELHESQQQ